jgi:hypothetical protein
VKVAEDKVKTVRVVDAQFSPDDVKSILRYEAAQKLGLLDDVEVYKVLRVDLSHNSTSFVRGEVPLTREQLLESLGLTPTEPVETEGAAVAEEFAHGARPPQAPDLVLPDVAFTTYRLVTVTDVSDLRRQLDELEAQPGGKHSTVALRKVVEALESGLGPAVGDNQGVQLGSGAYAPESEVLPEVQVHDAGDYTLEDMVLEALQLVDFTRLVEERALSLLERDALSALLHNAVARLGVKPYSLPDERRRLVTYVAPEPVDETPVVPRRGPTTDCLETAREKVRELHERQFYQGVSLRAQDLAYLYALLGGEGEL